MLTGNVASLLRNAQTDSSLAEQVRRSDNNQALEELSARAGATARAGALRSAFTDRNARVLVQQMICRGVIDPSPLPDVPTMDQAYGIGLLRWTSLPW